VVLAVLSALCEIVCSKESRIPAPKVLIRSCSDKGHHAEGQRQTLHVTAHHHESFGVYRQTNKFIAFSKKRNRCYDRLPSQSFCDESVQLVHLIDVAYSTFTSFRLMCNLRNVTALRVIDLAPEITLLSNGDMVHVVQTRAFKC